VRRTLERDLARRYQSWQAFSDDLVATASGDMPRPRQGVFETEQFDTLRTLSFFRAFGDVELWEVLRFGEYAVP